MSKRGPPGIMTLQLSSRPHQAICIYRGNILNTEISASRSSLSSNLLSDVRSTPSPVNCTRSASPRLRDDYQIYDRGHGQVQPVLGLRKARPPVPDVYASDCPSERHSHHHDYPTPRFERAQLSTCQVQCVDRVLFSGVING